MSDRARWNHRPCPGGCGELADECTCRRPRPLGSMRVEEPLGSRTGLIRLDEVAVEPVSETSEDDR